MRLVLLPESITSRQCPSSSSFNTPLHQGGGSFTAARDEIDAGLPAHEIKDEPAAAAVLPSTATVLPAAAVVLPAADAVLPLDDEEVDEIDWSTIKDFFATGWRINSVLFVSLSELESDRSSADDADSELDKT
jgi:hypothetical protein